MTMTDDDLTYYVHKVINSRCHIWHTFWTMKLIICLVLTFLVLPLGFTTNLGRLIKHLDRRLSQLVRDRYAGPLTYLTTINRMNSALEELAARVSNPKSPKGILRLGQAVISSGTPHFVKYNVTPRELQRRYRWSIYDLNDYYQLINKTICFRKHLDYICRKVSLEYKVYKYYYNSKPQVNIGINKTITKPTTKDHRWD